MFCTLVFLFLLFEDFESVAAVRALVDDDVTADDALPVAVLDGNVSGAPLVVVVGVLGGVGVELRLFVDREDVEIKGRLIFAELFSRSSGMTADSSSLRSRSFFTKSDNSTIYNEKYSIICRNNWPWRQGHA